MHIWSLLLNLDINLQQHPKLITSAVFFFSWFFNRIIFRSCSVRWFCLLLESRCAFCSCEGKHGVHPSCKHKNQWTKAVLCPPFPWLSFNKLPLWAQQDYGIFDIGYEHNLLGNGGYPLFLNPGKARADRVPTQTARHPFINTSPSRRSNPLQQQSLSIGSDTVWSVYHYTSNTWDSIRPWREIARAERWPTDGR